MVFLLLFHIRSIFLSLNLFPMLKSRIPEPYKHTLGLNLTCVSVANLAKVDQFLML